jgi:hypothetical protein
LQAKRVLLFKKKAKTKREEHDKSLSSWVCQDRRKPDLKVGPRIWGTKNNQYGAGFGTGTVQEMSLKYSDLCSTVTSKWQKNNEYISSHSKWQFPSSWSFSATL